MKIRAGGPHDADAVLAMFDGAVAWLVERGRTGQWGSTPFSQVPERVAMVAEKAAGGGMMIAEVDGVPAGCLVVGAPMPYVEPAAEPELYVQVLVTDRARAGHGVGRALLQWARAEAVRRGARLLRVDCYAGDDGALVAFYESCGFTREEEFTVGAWPGQVLAMRLP